MAFDGFVVASLVTELREKLEQGRIFKIAQPEKDAIVLTIKKEKKQYRLFISAQASLPLLYIMSGKKENPMVAPGFCMLLRKHLQNAKLVSISQPGMERVVVFTWEHLNELGDRCMKKLIVELMGKHSNLIFCDETNQVIDAIKRIPHTVSSVREILPGKPYFIVAAKGKEDPNTISFSQWKEKLQEKKQLVQKAIYTSLVGCSPLLAREICTRAQVSLTQTTDCLTQEQEMRLYEELQSFLRQVKNGTLHPNIVFEKEYPIEFSCFSLLQMEQNTDCKEVAFESISETLEMFYAQKEKLGRIKQKSTDLRKMLEMLIERAKRKRAIQQKQLQETKEYDQYRMFGELIHIYGYQIQPGETILNAQNYETQEEVEVLLDPNLTKKENAKKYFARYEKQKRTHQMVAQRLEQTEAELLHLESMQSALELITEEADITQIKEEMILCGYIRKHLKKEKREKKTENQPLHYQSSDGFDIYVGKNNLQNEFVTFQMADGGDWWFHAKGIAGSHVIVKANHRMPPDRTFEEAAQLAGYYSKGRGQEKIEIDYTKRKYLKKPAGAKPGFVVYETYYSLVTTPQIEGIKA